MIYELDKRQLLRLWSVLSSFGEIRETNDPIFQSEILRRAQLVLTDFVFRLKLVPEDQTGTTPLDGGLSQTVTFDAWWERANRTMALWLPTQIRGFAEQPVSAFGRQAARHYVTQLTLVPIRLD